MDEENAIVLHEDKQYYPDASEVYGENVETVVLDEDAQPIEEPIIAPVDKKTFSALDKEIPETNYQLEFLCSLTAAPALVRNVALVGHLHHGKTVFCDLLVSNTHRDAWDTEKEVRYSDTRTDEQERQLSIKSTPLSLVLENTKGKSYLVNVLDCPGHPNFADESCAAMRAADGVVLLVDALEGVMVQTEKMIKQAVLEDLPIVVVINKMDRLILELKLPPRDAYYKISHTLDEINDVIRKSAVTRRYPRISPERGNVVFASAQHDWAFSLTSFAAIYAARHNYPMNPKELAKRLWGDAYLDADEGKFRKRPQHSDQPRSFVELILEPLYKIYSHVVGEDAPQLHPFLRRLGVQVKRSSLHLNSRPLLRLVCRKFFGAPTGFVDAVVDNVPSPVKGAVQKARQCYTGEVGEGAGPLAEAIASCDPNGPLLVNVVKLYSNPEGDRFHALGRIYSGTVAKGQQVKVLGEAYSLEDEEDMAICAVESVAIPEGRYNIEVDQLGAGNWVMLQGVDATINKTATLAGLGAEGADATIFKPLKFNETAVVKLAVEPLRPSELPKMVEGLRRINKSYPLSKTKVEESGEHVVCTTGELALDCIMHDLREMYSKIEVKVADPVVSFRETVIETSSLKCFAETPNKHNRLTMIAEPLDNGLAEDIELGEVDIAWSKKKMGGFFQEKYDWDLLAARSVWAFGPEISGPNVLLDDTLASEVDKSLLNTVKESTIQGFQWCCREGPLCEEPVRGVKFKLLDVSLASEPIHRGGGQIIPTARRAAYSSLLLATPRLMEPIYSVQIQAPADVVGELYPVLARRRGHVVRDQPKPGAPFYTMEAFLPAMDSFGFETDLRSFSQGQAMCYSSFSHWAVVPGDPLDRNITLHPLEPSPPPHLARDFMVKTRRRKGLTEDVAVNSYFDAALIQQLAAQGL
uniref:Tr-type G domain-containing protein n=1 Tax=Phaeomonas parva TaxID=124430 RepID=A0A7S1U9A6_9STRA